MKRELKIVLYSGVYYVDLSIDDGWVSIKTFKTAQSAFDYCVKFHADVPIQVFIQPASSAGTRLE